MKISFVVPVYKKSEEVLRRSLESLFTQSHKDIEVIVVLDGGGTPLSFAQAQWFQVEHGGAPKARNFGLEKATGDFVSFWDADCYAEPEMAERWVKELTKDPTLDFVYQNYSFTDPRQPGHIAESYDPYSLSKYNYISTMFPVRRSVCPKWDESLKGLQDWDFWRRVSAAGLKGTYIGGYGFVTEMPDKDSISFKTREAVIEQIEIIRKKHEDPKADILVQGDMDKIEALKIAKLLKADIFNWNYWLTREYKFILQVGFNPKHQDHVSYLLENTASEIPKALYWLGPDAENIGSRLPFNMVKYLKDQFRERVKYHFCGDLITKHVLDDLGIESEILHLPRHEGEIEITIPKEFKVFVHVDDVHFRNIDGIVKAMPDIKFMMMVPGEFYSIEDYSLCLQYTESKRMSQGTMNMLLLGRNVISNVQEPYAGYLPCAESVTEFRNKIIEKIRGFEENRMPNLEASNYYKDLHDPEKFKAKIAALIPSKLEVVP